MARYVTVDSGTYFWTDDINLWDGDVGNIQQGYGNWHNHRNSTVALVADGGAEFGDNVLQWDVPSTEADSVIATARGSDDAYLQLTTNTEYRANVRVKATSGMNIRLTPVMWELRNGGAVAVLSSSTTYTASGDWEWLTHTFTPTDASKTWLALNLYSIPGRAGDQCLVDTATISESSKVAVDTFVPSLRIVANDTYTKDPSGIAAAFTSGVSLKVGDGWAGDAVTVELADGVGGPVVAKFDADDVRAAYPFGDLTTGSTWTDDTGRTWTLTGTGATLGFTSFKHEATVAAPGQLLHTGG